VLEFRRARVSDLDAVTYLWHESAQSMGQAPDPMPPRHELRQRIDDELASGWELHIALCGDRPVGMLALRPADAILDQLFVLPSEQGRGVGKALLDLAKNRMPGGFTLHTPSSNRRAQQFYEREGLRLFDHDANPRTGETVNFYRWDAR
jgi:GNAT superfamily N-acetyltransferase